MIKAIKFASIPVTDQDRALEFYTKKLGFRVILDNLLEEHGVLRHNTRRFSRLLLEEFLHR